MAVSIFIQTLNEEENLPGCLDSVAWADDIVVLDSFSKDRTEAICREHGCRFFQRKYDGRGSHQNWAMENIPWKHKWVFYLDADERMTPELKEEILRIAADAEEKRVAFFCGRKNFFMGAWLKHSMPPGHIMRFFQPDKIRFERLANPIPIIAGAHGYLKHHFLHYNFSKGLWEWFERHNKYSTYEAIETMKALKASPVVLGNLFSRDPATRRAELKNVSHRLPALPFLKFLYMYFLQLGCLDGRPGLTYCVIQTIYQYQIALKVREMKRALKGLPNGLPPELEPMEAKRITDTISVGGRAKPPGAPELDVGTTAKQRFGRLIKPGTRVIITGASGFIGTNLLDFCDKAGAQVINLDIEPPRNPEQQRFWRNIDIRDFDSYNRVVRDFDPELFFHLAARTDLDETKDINGYSANSLGVENTLKSVEGLKNLRRIIITSSQLVCRPGYTPKDENDYAPHTVYGESKILTEKITRAWKNAPCPWTLLRPTSIWGPWFHIPYKTFFLMVAERKYMHQRGVNPLRSFGFVGNGVFEYAAMVNAPESAIDRKTFYLSDAQPVRVRDWADMIQREMGIEPLREVPLSALKVAAKGGDFLQSMGWKTPPLTSFRLKNLTGDNVTDMSHVTAVIGEMPYTIAEGVKMTVDWMRREGSIVTPVR